MFSLREFRLLKVMIRSSIIKSVREVHEAGLKHGDVGETHVLLSDEGSPAILAGFGGAVITSCELKMEIIPIRGGVEPLHLEFGCSELHDVCRRLRIWKPCTYRASYSPRIARLHSARWAIAD
ncbi:hypothetical protein OF83DRAFT_306205 [Amylostereum chailletii]|nr:hypothetical protein OF83DRAFT_306205 [Amylostereum chailletii]